MCEIAFLHGWCSTKEFDVLFDSDIHGLEKKLFLNVLNGRKNVIVVFVSQENVFGVYHSTTIKQKCLCEFLFSLRNRFGLYERWFGGVLQSSITCFYGINKVFCFDGCLYDRNLYISTRGSNIYDDYDPKYLLDDDMESSNKVERILVFQCQ
ncbi:hypothetical protein QTN25_007910 [Entamoeba marina]